MATLLPTPGSAELVTVLEIASAIAREAGTLVLEGWRRGARTRTKADRSDLVTEFDERCERLIRERIAAAFPSHDVIGEEGQGVSDGARRVVWYVDPIDGTTNFAHGHPFFCLAMGLALRSEDGRSEEPMGGIVLAPAMKTEWAAGKGLGATRNGERCVVSATSELPDALFATGFPSSRARTEDNNYGPFLAVDAASHGARRCGAAAMELCLVADGAYDGFWDIGLKRWDVTAGAVIVAEAGGRVTGIAGEPLDVLAFEPGGGRVVATNGILHDALVRGVGGALPRPPLRTENTQDTSPVRLRPGGGVG